MIPQFPPGKRVQTRDDLQNAKTLGYPKRTVDENIGFPDQKSPPHRLTAAKKHLQ
jgi:hypothetical protein